MIRDEDVAEALSDIYRKTPKLYNLEVPGQRVQMDVCKITNDLYQYTAIDDCTRYKILNIYPKKTANCTVDFINMAIKEMHFPIQRFQTDRGKEFFAYEVQELMQKNKIKFRPIKPRSPHLNGKVERSQRTDLDEFYSDTNPKEDPNLEIKLKDWQNHYNNKRSHTSLNGRTPLEQLNDKKMKLDCSIF
jgi:transposase InsO family protein